MRLEERSDEQQRSNGLLYVRPRQLNTTIPAGVRPQ